MNQIHPDVSLTPILTRITAFGNMHYHLYSNALTVDRSNVLGDFTECSSAGYALVAVAPGDWATDSLVAHNASRSAPDIAFTASSGSYTANGYYITDSADAVLLGCATFPSTVTIDPSNPLILTPKWGDVSKFSS